MSDAWDEAPLELEIPDQPAPAAPPAGAQGAVETAVRAAVESASLSALDAGAAALAIGQARSVDVALAAAKPNPYAVAAISRELSMQLARLGLDPASRKDAGGAGGLDEEWAKLQADVQAAIRGSAQP